MMGIRCLIRVIIAVNAFLIVYFAIYLSSTQFTPYHQNLKSGIGKESSQTKLKEASVRILQPPTLIPPSPINPASARNPVDKVQEVEGPPAQQQPLQSPVRTVKQEAPNEAHGRTKSIDSQIGSIKSETQLDTNGTEEVISREDPLNRHMNFGKVASVAFKGKRVDSGVGGNSSNSESAKLSACHDSTPKTRFGRRGRFKVLYNYIMPRKHFPCDESITYTTHADFTFLDNLIPLLERWEGPISLAIYSPGTDFNDTLKRIHYLRECTSGSVLVKDFVTFHLFFEYKHKPKIKIPRHPGSTSVICSDFKAEDFEFGEQVPTYKKRMNLTYPVNVARNVARQMTTTHYVLPSDIELYPNPKLISDFLEMIRRNDTRELQSPNPNKVYVLPIFEVEANVSRLPVDKSELVSMLRNDTAVPFHLYVCPYCHEIPRAEEWTASPILPGLNVFHVGRRQGKYDEWEPIFIGTRKDPPYDERLTWEGRSDKMTQGYVLCVLDYEFHILDNAFLVHRPGIKRRRKGTIIPKNPVVLRQNRFIKRIILPELKRKFGKKPGCRV